MGVLASTPRERLSWVEDNCRRAERVRYDRINTGINILVSLLCCFLTGFNILFFALTFILCDIALTLVDTYLFSVTPNRIANYNIEEMQEYVKKLEKKYNKYSSDFKNKSKDICRKCNLYHSYDNTCWGGTDECMTYTMYAKYKSLYTNAKDRLDKMVEEKKKEIALKDDRKSVVYTNKIEYFQNLKIKIDVFMKEKDMKFLKTLSVELKELLGILEKKPYGASMISNSMYVYLDELVNVLNELSTLDSENKDEYLAKVEKITLALKNEIADVSRRISDSDEHSIDISIRTLMRELVEEEEDTNV